MSEATTDSLMQASFSSFSTRFFFGGAHRHQIGAVAGQIPQPPDRPGGTKWAAASPVSDLAQPHRIQHIGLRSTRHMFDIAGVDQPRIQPVRLQ